VTGGATHAADAVALQAQNDVTTAYNALAAQTPCTDLTGQDLGGMTLTEDVYCFSSSAQLTGPLTLNAQGNAAAVFIFQIGSTLTTASNSSVSVINGGTACNVFWQVGSSATIGTTTQFVGNILALTSIALQTGATMVPGRALARNGEVTMDTNNVTILGCPGAPAAQTATPAATTTPPAATTTTPASPSPTSPAVSLPGTGGGPLESGGFSWTLLLAVSVMVGLGAVVLGVSALG
jgi:type VI secretion system secreted protein VgrG